MSDPIIISAPAKLNLYLHVKNKLTSGYHSITSFIVFINLNDIITVAPASYNREDTLNITGNLGQQLQLLTPVSDNLIFRVLQYIKQRFKINQSVTITLNKNIPIGAGLGGGSADAAAVLKALNILWNLNLDITQLCEIAQIFGADVPSCVHSRSGFIQGIGEIYHSIPLNFTLPILLINNYVSLSTQAVYSKLTNLSDSSTTHEHHEFNGTTPMDKDHFLAFVQQQSNHLTEAAISLLPELKEILINLQATNPIVARMTGSGSSCFAIYQNPAELLKGYQFMQKLYPKHLIFQGNTLT